MFVFTRDKSLTHWFSSWNNDWKTCNARLDEDGLRNKPWKPCESSRVLFRLTGTLSKFQAFIQPGLSNTDYLKQKMYMCFFLSLHEINAYRGQKLCLNVLLAYLLVGGKWKSFGHTKLHAANYIHSAFLKECAQILNEHICLTLNVLWLYLLNIELQMKVVWSHKTAYTGSSHNAIFGTWKNSH